MFLFRCKCLRLYALFYALVMLIIIYVADVTLHNHNTNTRVKEETIPLEVKTKARVTSFHSIENRLKINPLNLNYQRDSPRVFENHYHLDNVINKNELLSQNQHFDRYRPKRLLPGQKSQFGTRDFGAAPVGLLGNNYRDTEQKLRQNTNPKIQGFGAGTGVLDVQDEKLNFAPKLQVLNLPERKYGNFENEFRDDIDSNMEVEKYEIKVKKTWLDIEVKRKNLDVINLQNHIGVLSGVSRDRNGDGQGLNTVNQKIGHMSGGNGKVSDLTKNVDLPLPIVSPKVGDIPKARVNPKIRKDFESLDGNFVSRHGYVLTTRSPGKWRHLSVMMGKTWAHKQTTAPPPRKTENNLNIAQPMIERGTSKISIVNTVMLKAPPTVKTGSLPTRPIQTPPSCTPKEEFVYIKTHKTASSTTCNLFYRYALKNNLPMLLFTLIPFPLVNITQFMLHYEPMAGVRNPSERKFKVAADHIRYEREELDKVMTGNPAYITTLRYPPDQLRSLFHYFNMDVLLEMGPMENPVEYYIQNRHMFLTPDPMGPYRLENRNANMFGMAENDTKNVTAINLFLQKLDSEFSLVMITEHFVESLVMLRRTMCWGLGDVVFASINQRWYHQKGEPLSPQLQQVHRDWNMADYMMYEYFNKTLWRKIREEGRDFWEEMDMLWRFKTKVDQYCANVYRSLLQNPDVILVMYNFTRPLILPATRWGGAVAIDYVTCALMRVDIMPFANLMRIKQYPDLCQRLADDSTDLQYLTFRLDKFHQKIHIMPKYCGKNVHKTIVPLESLTIPNMYMWM